MSVNLNMTPRLRRVHFVDALDIKFHREGHLVPAHSLLHLRDALPGKRGLVHDGRAPEEQAAPRLRRSEVNLD